MLQRATLCKFCRLTCLHFLLLLPWLPSNQKRGYSLPSWSLLIVSCYVRVRTMLHSVGTCSKMVISSCFPTCSLYHCLVSIATTLLSIKRAYLHCNLFCKKVRFAGKGHLFSMKVRHLAFSMFTCHIVYWVPLVAMEYTWQPCKSVLSTIWGRRDLANPPWCVIPYGILTQRSDLNVFTSTWTNTETSRWLCGEKRCKKPDLWTYCTCYYGCSLGNKLLIASTISLPPQILHSSMALAQMFPC